MRRFLRSAGSFLTAFALFAVPGFVSSCNAQPGPGTPFVICQNQRYALCATASCFVYNGVAYCKCNVMQGNSISLQLNFSSAGGEQNVCSVMQQSVGNGLAEYLVSTFSLPQSGIQGGTAAIYTCPGAANAGSGVIAPVAYGQCDGGICFTSSRGKQFPGFSSLQSDEIICSCPISTSATPASTNQFGYQIFGPYNPAAPPGSKCDASACAKCSVSNPTANGSMLQVGAPTGTAEALTFLLTGSPPPPLNKCPCTCSSGPNGVTCTLGAGAP